MDQHRCSACRDGTEIFPFSMAFQPIVDIVAERIDAYEALVRGPNGEGAGEVLARVTADNLYAFDQACRVRALELAGRLGLDRTLNINFLPNAVYDPRACIRRTLAAAAQIGFPLDRLTFEIVEHEQMVTTEHLLSIVAEYRRHGFRIALDDFGTAFSGLQRLAEIRPDIVKLDRALVAGCDRDAYRRGIVRAMAGLCAQLGIKLVAEGIERRAELETLRGLGVRFLQGFHLAKPRFEALVREAEIFPLAPRRAKALAGGG